MAARGKMCPAGHGLRRLTRTLGLAAMLAAMVPAAASASMSTVAGTGIGGFSAGDEGALATAANINGPRGVAWMLGGGFVFADFMNERVRRVGPDGRVSTLAGNGQSCPSPTNPCGDGGPATSAQLRFVHGVAVLADGSVVIADELNNRIRKVNAATGIITTVAGTGSQGFSGDGGPATLASIYNPRSVATRGNDIYIPDTGNGRIRKVDGSTGIITTVAGGGSQVPPLAGAGTVSATSAALSIPFSVAPTSDGGLLIADPGRNEIDRVSPGGNITRVAGQGLAGSFASSGDGGPATSAAVSLAHSAVEVPSGGFLIAEMPPALSPESYPNNRIRYVATDGTITTVVNTSGVAGSTGDGGDPAAAQINGPRGLSMRADGAFLIAEFGPPDFSQAGGDRIRSVTLDPAPPAAPTGVSAVGGAGQVALDWADSPESDAAGYDVYRSTTTGGPYTKVNAARVSASAYTDTAVTGGTAYFYVIRAIDTAGNQSANSGQVSATPTTSTPPPPPPPAPYRDAVLATPGLVSYWRLGESSGSVATDAKGSNNGAYAAGTLLGQPGLVANDTDTSAGFDGVDDRVQVPDFPAPTNISLEAWIRPLDTATGNNRIIIDKGNPEYDLRIVAAGNLVFVSGSPAQTAVDDTFNYSTPANSNRTYHVAVTFDAAADTVRFYRDGALTKTVTGFTATIQDTSTPLWIGRHSAFDFGTFNGRIDEAAIYNTVLPAATVTQHYQAGSGPPDTTAPAAPTGVSATAGVGQVALNWADSPESDVAGYDVYRSTTTGGPYTKVNATLVSPSAYTDTGVTGGTAYFYVIRAVDNAGNQSPNSGQVSATPTAPPVSAYRQAVLATSGLISYWRLGESSGSVATDAKGSNNGTYTNGTLLGQAGLLAGDTDTSAGFDGADDRVQVSDIPAPTNISLEAWIRPLDTATGTNRIIIDKGNPEYDLRIVAAGNLVFVSGSPAQTAVDDTFNYFTPANANRTYHVAVTFDAAADTVRFYRDGVLTKTVTAFTAAIQDTSTPLWIGRHSAFDFGTFNGRIDEAAIYNTVLPAATVTQHYQAGSGPSGPPDTTAPAPPTGVSATAGVGQVALDWADSPESDVAGYDVYRSTTTGGPYSKVNATLVSPSAYTDAAVTAGTPYFYVIRAIDATGNQSPDSGQVSATPTAPPVSAYRQAVLATAGLVSYWRLGESSGSVATDAKGSNNGTYSNGTLLGQAGLLAGDTDTSAGFDGDDDRVQVPDFPAPTNISLEAWIRPLDTATGTNRIIIDKGNPEYDLRIVATGNLLLAVGNPTQSAVDDTFNYFTPANANRTYHIAVTFDAAADTVRFYRDGVLTKTVTGFTATIQDTSNALWIGRHSAFDFGTFNGRIDEAAIYNTVVPAATITQHYQAGS